MNGDFEVEGTNAAAAFTMKLHRGDGMCLLGMDWRDAKGPPQDFVGFAIEYREPDGDRFYPLKNRLCFPGADGKTNPDRLSTRLSPIQKFRWVHFPRNAELQGAFRYRVTPVFMNDKDELSYGEAQEADIELRRETYPGALDIAFTRGFVSSQAFVDRYGGEKAVKTILPADPDQGLSFKPTNPKAKEALAWMGFEARSAVLEVLDQAIADTGAEVRVVVYDLNEPEIVGRLEQLGKRLRIIIDDDGSHGEPGSCETQAQARLVATAGGDNVKRQHMGGLQHNKTVAVRGANGQIAVFGSTNHSWRGFYVQNNNAVVVRTKAAVDRLFDAFDAYWASNDDTAIADFNGKLDTSWQDLGVPGVDAQVAFSPHNAKKKLLDKVASDVSEHTGSSLFFSLAFLYQTPGAMLNAFKKIRKDKTVFSYGISDHAVKDLPNEPDATGVDVQKPDGSLTMVDPSALTKNVPEPFKAEPVGGSGTRMHHKFVVIDFDTPDARVYTGSFNFSTAADGKNGENLLLIRDRRIAVSYVVEAVRIFDHYEFRLAQEDAKKAKKKLQLRKPPRTKGEAAWFAEDYADARKIRDRLLFS
jgi:phosphatidylserine/phosphatidylglycerophosphate/cardiolipin synthase-like enzyme